MEDLLTADHVMEGSTPPDGFPARDTVRHIQKKTPGPTTRSNLLKHAID